MWGYLRFIIYSALHCRLHSEILKMCLWVLYRDRHRSWELGVRGSKFPMCSNLALMRDNLAGSVTDTQNQTWFLQFRSANGSAKHCKIALCDAVVTRASSLWELSFGLIKLQGQRISRDKTGDPKRLMAFDSGGNAYIGNLLRQREVMGWNARNSPAGPFRAPIGYVCSSMRKESDSLSPSIWIGLWMCSWSFKLTRISSINIREILLQGHHKVLAWVRQELEPVPEQVTGTCNSTGKVRFGSGAFDSNSGGSNCFSRLAHWRPFIHQAVFLPESAMPSADWLVSWLITTCLDCKLMITNMQGEFKCSGLTGT